jgi:hypothetical protein
MKTYIKLMLFLLTGIIIVPANAAFTYDPETKILEDDIWKFEGVSLAKDGVTLGTVKGSMATKKPETPQPLDFSNVKDTNGKSYNVVTIGGFGGFNVSEVNAPECTGFSGQNCFSGCASLRKVILNSAFKAFGGARAFSGCTSLEEFEPRTLLVTEVTGSAFASCEKLSGTFYLPNCTLIKTHAFSGCKLLTSVMAPKVTEIQDGAFSGCASMSKIEIISSLGKTAFAEIASGAELYMPETVPESLAALFTGNLLGPYPKVVLKDNYDDYLNKISENHYVVRREDFNNRDIEFEGKSWKWDLVAEKMSSDTVICTVGTDKTVSLKVRNVLAFIIEKDSAQNKASNLSCFWVMKTPKKGFKVVVR